MQKKKQKKTKRCPGQYGDELIKITKIFKFWLKLVSLRK